MVSPRWALILLLVCSLAGCKKKEEARRAQRAGEVLHPYESRKAGVGEPLQPDVPRKAGAGESTHPNVGLKAGEDRPARPAILATPPSKNTGAPPWASSQAAVHPQPVKPSEIFDALRLAPVKGAEAKDVVVICRAKAKGRFDA